MNGRGWGTEGGDEWGPGMAGAGHDVNDSSAISACVASIAGNDGRGCGVSNATVGRERCWANARRRRWFDGSGVLPAFAGSRLCAAWDTGRLVEGRTRRSGHKSWVTLTSRYGVAPWRRSADARLSRPGGWKPED